MRPVFVILIALLILPAAARVRAQDSSPANPDTPGTAGAPERPGRVRRERRARERSTGVERPAANAPAPLEGQPAEPGSPVPPASAGTTGPTTPADAAPAPAVPGAPEEAQVPAAPGAPAAPQPEAATGAAPVTEAGAPAPAPADAALDGQDAAPGSPPGAPAPRATVSPEAAPARSAVPRPAAPAAAPAPAAVPARAVGARPAPILPPRPTFPDWQRVFARTPLGFSRDTPGLVYGDLAGTARALARSPESALAAAATPGWAWWLSAAALVLLLAGGLWTERVSPRGWRRLWRLPRVLARRDPSLGVLLTLAQRVTVPLAVLACWSFATLLLESSLSGNTAAFEVTRGLLGLWTGYRAADALLQHVSRGEAAAEGGGSLPETLHRLAAATALWLAAWLVMETAGYRSDGVALWIAAGHLALVLGVFGILVQKQRVLALLPEFETPAYRAFRRALSTVYLPLVYFSLLIALLWVGGYRSLAAVFLGRSWAVVGICLLAFGLYQGSLRFLRARLSGEDILAVQRAALLPAAQRVFAAISIGLAVVLCMDVLGLWELWRFLVDRPWIDLGTVRTTGSSIIASAIIVLSIVLFSGLLQALLAYRVYPRVGLGTGEAYALNRLLHYALFAGAVLLVLNNLGLSPESLALVAGGLSVGIGFGLQDVAKNIASGLIMLTTRQVRQGDVISVGDEMGTVREVNLRSTLVTTADNVDLLIPNSKLLDDTLINWTHSGTLIRAKVPFGVSYQADPGQVIETALEVARRHPEVLDEPPADVWLRRMGDNALEFELLVWVDLQASVRPKVATQLYCGLIEEFTARQIDVPFPQRDLHLRSGVPWDELLKALAGRTPPVDSSAAARDGAAVKRESRG